MNKNDHTAYRVSDLDASIRFYSDSLGLRLLSRRVSHEVQEATAFLELDGGNLELIQTLDTPFNRPEPEPPYCPHLAIETQDMHQLLATVQARGITVVKGPLEIPGQEKWLYICDPDNNVIEFIEWTSRGT